MDKTAQLKKVGPLWNTCGEGRQELLATEMELFIYELEGWIPAAAPPATKKKTGEVDKVSIKKAVKTSTKTATVSASDDDFDIDATPAAAQTLEDLSPTALKPLSRRSSSLAARYRFKKHSRLESTN